MSDITTSKPPLPPSSLGPPDLISHKDGQRSFHTSTNELLKWRKAIYSRYFDASLTGATSIKCEDRDFHRKFFKSNDDILALELHQDVYMSVFEIHYDGIKALKVTFYFKNSRTRSGCDATCLIQGLFRSEWAYREYELLCKLVQDLDVVVNPPNQPLRALLAAPEPHQESTKANTLPVQPSTSLSLSDDATALSTPADTQSTCYLVDSLPDQPATPPPSPDAATTPSTPADAQSTLADNLPTQPAIPPSSINPAVLLDVTSETLNDTQDNIVNLLSVLNDYKVQIGRQMKVMEEERKRDNDVLTAKINNLEAENKILKSKLQSFEDKLREYRKTNDGLIKSIKSSTNIPNQPSTLPVTYPISLSPSSSLSTHVPPSTSNPQNINPTLSEPLVNSAPQVSNDESKLEAIPVAVTNSRYSVLAQMVPDDNDEAVASPVVA